MKIPSIIALLLFQSAAFSQSVDKLIKEKEVKRILYALTDDNLKGRSAYDEPSIFKAAGIIEKEFQKIGLKPLTGNQTFLQEFSKNQITTSSVEVVIDGEKISNENVLMVTEKTDVHINNGLVLKTIKPDAGVTDKNQYFFRQAFQIYRDTISTLILIDPEFKNIFQEFKGYFTKRFAQGRKGINIFVLGKTTATSYSVRASQKNIPVRLANVVGVLEGKSKKDEMAVFSGHYDHIGIRTKINGDSIANGADDDASGTTAVIQLARYFKKTKQNERTLIFVAFTAEEIGGYGSQYFSKQLDAEKIITMFNIEMIGKPSKWGINSAFITGYERSDFGEILQKNLQGTPFQFKPDPYPEQNLFYRSDNATLARLGVPAHSISTDQIDTDKLYHSVDDEAESLDIKNLTVTIRAIAISSKSIVNGTDTPKRIDKSMVK